MKRISTIVAIGATLTLGCASSAYAPQEPGRLYVVRASGSTALERDGKLYSMSGFRGDLIEAVSGNAAAEEHARIYVSRTRTSAAVIALGLASIGAGGVVYTNEPGHMERRVAGTGIALAGALTSFISLLALVSARPHLYDAINIYNDGVFMRHQSGLPIPTSATVDVAAARSVIGGGPNPFPVFVAPAQGEGEEQRRQQARSAASTAVITDRDAGRSSDR